MPVSENFPESAVHTGAIHPDDQDAYIEVFDRVRKSVCYAEGILRIRTAKGNYLWCRIGVTSVADENGRPYKAVGLITDIDSQKREASWYKEKAKRDSLTKLYNKGTTEELIRTYIKEKEGFGRAVLFVIDIDNFKGINDNMGHSCGDTILGQLAQNIAAQFRETDIVGRFGGDEFIVFAKDVKPNYDIKKNGEKLIRTLQGTFDHQNFCCEVSGSVGIARYPEDGVTYQELFENADRALYYAKRHGKNCYAVYRDTIGREPNET